jgi:DNA-binding CsgD family transcriptional regulator
VPDCRPGPVYIRRWPAVSPRPPSCPRRYARRPGKLTPAQESTIRALAGTKSLRSLAADFGVSHETVRAVLLDRPGRR